MVGSEDRRGDPRISGFSLAGQLNLVAAKRTSNIPIKTKPKLLGSGMAVIVMLLKIIPIGSKGPSTIAIPKTVRPVKS